jgi:hypothetical protein
VTLAKRAFVGSVLNAGGLSSCPSDYAADQPKWQSWDLEGSFQEVPEGASGIGTGVETLLPGGTWTLCGWVQPEGEGAGVVATATAGPVVFTVGGPEGTTNIPATPVFGQEQAVTVQVAYDLTQSAGQIPGVAQAALYLSADCTPGSAYSGRWLTPDHLAPPEFAAVISAPSSGTELFTGHLAPGTHTLCAWLVQDLPQPTNLPNLAPGSFGLSAGSLTVLAQPVVAHLSGVAHRATRHRHGSVVAQYSLNVPASVVVTLSRIIPARHPSSGALCVRNPRTGRRVCGAARTVASLRGNAATGADAAHLAIPRGGLAPGVYQLSVSAENEAHEVGPATSTVLAVGR